jgi:hypothetical protein
MNWENYGPVWHVDHIKPCNKFDLSNSRAATALFSLEQSPAALCLGESG